MDRAIKSVSLNSKTIKQSFWIVKICQLKKVGDKTQSTIARFHCTYLQMLHGKSGSCEIIMKYEGIDVYFSKP